MKKRIFSLILCVLLICLTFVSCGKSTDSLINNALEKTKSSDTMSAIMNMEVSMSINDMAVSVPVTVTVKAKDLNTKKPISHTLVAMTMMEKKIDMELYQEGSDGYVIIEDVKYKTNITGNNSQYDFKDDINNLLKELPKEILAEVEAIKDKNNSTSIEISLDGDKFTEIYNDFIGNITQNTGISGSEIKISDAVVKITVKDGYISVYGMEFNTDMTVDGTKATTRVRASVTFDSINEEVEITPPLGYEHFEDAKIVL